MIVFTMAFNCSQASSQTGKLDQERNIEPDPGTMGIPQITADTAIYLLHKALAIHCD